MEDSETVAEDDGTTRERRVTLHTYGDTQPEFCDAPRITRQLPGYANPDGDDHEAEHIPGSFANSASISVSEYDEVTVTISVGDPRGAFAMTVHRNDDGQLVLSVPDPSDGFAHMNLSPAGPGRFLIS